jgi:hypothetical protein
MRHSEANYLAATCEVMFLHVNQKGIVRSTEMPAETQTLLGKILEDSKHGPPVQAGRSIQLRK